MTENWLPAWPPCQICPRRSATAFWRWLSLIGRLEGEVTLLFSLEIQPLMSSRCGHGGRALLPVSGTRVGVSDEWH